MAVPPLDHELQAVVQEVAAVVGLQQLRSPTAHTRSVRCISTPKRCASIVTQGSKSGSGGMAGIAQRPAAYRYACGAAYHSRAPVTHVCPSEASTASSSRSAGMGNARRVHSVPSQPSTSGSPRPGPR